MQCLCLFVCVVYKLIAIPALASCHLPLVSGKAKAGALFLQRLRIHPGYTHFRVAYFRGGGSNCFMSFMGDLLFQRMGTTNRKLKWTSSQQTQSVVWGRPKAVGKMKICLIEGQFKVISGLKLVTNCEWVTAAGGIWVSEKKERKGHWKEERRRKREERRGVARATRLSSTPRAAGDLRTPS